MIITQSKDKQTTNLTSKNKSESSQHNLGEKRLTETVLATP
ncbi:hypothetical protein [Sporosarcina sp. YIM B06819]|nr:hypothetical protein [Sporosarcina sp. YIM B06819]